MSSNGDFYFGLERIENDDLGRFATRDVLGRPHMWIGGTEWILWHMDEAGRVCEVDDQEMTFYVADSFEKRLEQVAFEACSPGEYVEKVDGFHGAALASALGLVPFPAPGDSRQRYWGTSHLAPGNDDVIVVRESREPVDYGEEVLGDFTWISAGTAKRRKEMHRALSAMGHRA